MNLIYLKCMERINHIPDILILLNRVTNFIQAKVPLTVERVCDDSSYWLNIRRTAHDIVLEIVLKELEELPPLYNL